MALSSLRPTCTQLCARRTTLVPADTRYGSASHASYAPRSAPVARSPSALERAETLWHAGRPNAKKAPRPARPTRYDRAAARDGGRISVGAPRVRAPLQAKAIRDSWRTGRDARARGERAAPHPPGHCAHGAETPAAPSGQAPTVASTVLHPMISSSELSGAPGSGRVIVVKFASARHLGRSVLIELSREPHGRDGSARPPGRRAG